MKARTGEELFKEYGEELLGSWDDQTEATQHAWDRLAEGVNDLQLAKLGVISELDREWHEKRDV